MATHDTKRVLVVDDEETLTWSMMKTLSKDSATYELITANTGKEALRVLENNGINVVVTDIRMPDINGLDLLSTIREKYPGIKVIIMTAYGSPEVQKEASRRGSFHYLEKPFEIDDLRTLILDALDDKKGRFVGQVIDLQLVDIIQIGCLGKFTMAIHVSRGDDDGDIFIEDGDIVHAEVANLEGEEALYTVLGWKEGKFVSKTGMTPPKKTISARWEHLLLEGMKRSDDAAVSEDAESDLILQEVDQAFEDFGKEIERKEILEGVLRRLTHIDGYKGGVWVDEKGEIVATDIDDPAEKNVWIPLVLSTLAARLGRVMGDTSLHRIAVGSDRNQSMIMKHHDLLLMVALEEGTTADEFYASAKRILGRKPLRLDH